MARTRRAPAEGAQTTATPVKPKREDVELALQAIRRQAEAAREDLVAFYNFVIRHETTKKPLVCAPHQQLMFSFIQAHDRVVIRQPVGTAKCVAGDTPVADPLTGRRMPIREFIESDGALIHSWHPLAGVELSHASAKIRSGAKRCFRVTLDTGREIITTPEHPYITPMGWRRVDELAPGDSVGIATRVPLPLQPQAMHLAEIRLLALLFAEGSTTHHCGFSSGDPEMIRIATEDADWLGCDVVRCGEYDYRLSMRYSGTGRSPAMDFIEAHGMHGKAPTKKRIPEAIFSLGYEQLALFMAVLWACNGVVDEQGYPSITLASEWAIDDIQHLLLRCGVHTSKRHQAVAGKADSWRLNVRMTSGNPFLELMRVGQLWGHKRERLEQFADRAHNPTQGVATVSDEFVTEFSAAVAAAGVTATDVKSAMGYGDNRGLKDLCFSKRRGSGTWGIAAGFRVTVELAGLNSYQWVAGDGVYWDTVATIEEVGEREVFDLTVPGNHCFLANDIVAHNTFSLAAYALWMLGRDVTQRGGVISKTQGQAQGPVSMIRDYIEDPELSKRLRLVFPNLRQSSKASDPWSGKKLTVERPGGIRDASVTAAGVLTAIAGSRLSWIVADDTIDHENTHTEQARIEVNSRFDSKHVSRLDPRGSKAFVANTPWNPKDLTFHLERSGWPTITMDIYGFITFENASASWMVEAQKDLIRPSLIHAGKWRLRAFDPDPDEETPLFPERYNSEDIRVIRYGRDGKGGMLPFEFARTFLCQPFDESSARCQPAWIERCKALGMGLSLVDSYEGTNPVFMGVDLAIGKTRKSDVTVFFIFELLPNGMRRVLNIESGRYDGHVIVDMLIKFYDAYNVSVVAVENNQGQDFLRQWAVEKRPDISIHPHSTQAANKYSIDFGVESLFNELQNGAWIIPCDDDGRVHPEVQKFVDACLFFQPPPAHTPDHLMAAWFARERCRRRAGVTSSEGALGERRRESLVGGF